MSNALRRLGLAGAAAIPLAATFLAFPSASGVDAFPSIGTAGMSFSASVPTDPQRDVGEPEIHIANDGRIYTCGPSGFSNMADYMQVSTDGGDQFHLLGQAPRGQISVGEGGGDCGLATSPVENAQGHHTLAYSGLGPLTNFSTFTSKDSGRTITASAISESPVGVDRQWHVFTGPETVFLNYNHLATGHAVQKSTDGGLTYGPFIDAGTATGRIGPLRAILSPDGDADKALVYFPSYRNTVITVTRSVDGGATWATCDVIDTELNPSAGFVIADHDTAGNVYITYSEKGGEHDTYVTVLPAGRMAECSPGDFVGTGEQYRVNRDKVETTVMPWVVAGATGRIAIAFFGTESDGDPDSGAFVASWHPYVSMTLDALSGDPSWAQVQATTHPFHYGSICLGGLGCSTSVPEGDRSLADYFAMDISPTTGRLSIVYGNAAKKPTDATGHLSTATVVVQETGPNLFGGTHDARRPVLRSGTEDPTGDADAPYSQLWVAPSPVNVDALDVTNVTVGPQVDFASDDLVDEGGVTVTIKVANLGANALQSALTATNGQSLVWLFRFLNGYQPAGATLAWSPAAGFTAGFDDFTTKSTESGQADPTAQKIIVWPQATEIPSDVNQDSGIIRLSIPRSLLRAQSGPTGAEQVPELVDATDGSRFYGATVFTLSNSVSPVQTVQSYLYPVDAVASMDFIVGRTPAAAPKTGTPGAGNSGRSGGTPASPPRTGSRLPATGIPGALPFAAVGLVLAAGAIRALRRRAVRQD